MGTILRNYLRSHRNYPSQTRNLNVVALIQLPFLGLDTSLRESLRVIRVAIRSHREVDQEELGRADELSGVSRIPSQRFGGLRVRIWQNGLRNRTQDIENFKYGLSKNFEFLVNADVSKGVNADVIKEINADVMLTSSSESKSTELTRSTTTARDLHARLKPTGKHQIEATDHLKVIPKPSTTLKHQKPHPCLPSNGGNRNNGQTPTTAKRHWERRARVGFNSSEHGELDRSYNATRGPRRWSETEREATSGFDGASVGLSTRTAARWRECVPPVGSRDDAGPTSGGGGGHGTVVRKGGRWSELLGGGGI
ncbi:hypothetical protein V6N12_057328 [Hibiscus sabdariffa]|uniref:Uncharacterized protein n=1 Tax=Hibiscus sabdariffa TaxID=183260 RepID=A0ABR2DBW0_9ROSI